MPSDPCQWRLGDLIRSGDPLALKRHWTGPASHSGIMLDRHGWQAPGVSAIWVTDWQKDFANPRLGRVSQGTNRRKTNGGGAKSRDSHCAAPDESKPAVGRACVARAGPTGAACSHGWPRQSQGGLLAKARLY
jgi:hypothetical protein